MQLFTSIKDFINDEPNLAENFLEKLSPNEKIICGGGGYALYWYNKFFEAHGIRPDYILDKNEKIATEKYGIPLVDSDYLLNKEDLSVCKFVVTAPRFRKEIIEEIYNIFGDVQIYSFEAEIYCSFIKDIGEYRTYLLNHLNEMICFYNALTDSKSKETLIAFIKGRISGDQQYFVDIMVPDQYFPQDIIMLNSSETIAEIGANNGETLKNIVKRTNGQFEKIYCFEPDKECIKLLEEIIKKERGDIQLIKKGVGSHTQNLKFKTDSKWGASKVVEGEDYDYSIEITTLDSEIDTEVTYIKMDIEGMELNALKGAERILKKYKPKLAVCVYHEKGDIWEIFKYLNNLGVGYKFYLRHHNWGATETVLYAAVD